MPTLTGDDLLERARLALAVPLTAALGVRLLDERDPGAGVGFTVTGIAGNGAGGAHAAALAAAMEVAAYLALLPQLQTDEHAVTTASALQLLAAAPTDRQVEVVATADPRTSRLAFTSARAVCGGVVVARAQITKAVVRFAT